MKTSVKNAVLDKELHIAPARPPARSIAGGRARVLERRLLRVTHAEYHGIGGFGVGEIPQTADVHGGSGGVGIRNSFPCVFAEPPCMQAPV